MKVTQTTRFRRDLKAQLKRGRDLQKLRAVVDLLFAGELLPQKNRDHALGGDWLGWRDCHLEPDWLLIYKLLPDEIVLGRAGSHSDLF